MWKSVAAGILAADFLDAVVRWAEDTRRRRDARKAAERVTDRGVL
jgi:hypothetical protein